ncbi:MAG: bifunctional diaminohydroxyphosphoribosylaminopyrimidine deaminase/5-amino-6-(5-phosphoribosylamino)uracil reductase RibD [Candidatus Aminicenantes bacterium]|nr:MAG: bifunctional diaminohydroxyphosphoribosylaminopyrimidine deaminase/5-amino-6-(5-phosphoribosylamino)uracil reductase RibD [Candidatus Aminicenantes bacterium]
MKNFKDISYLQMAYSLAEKAKGWASPNPYVGAVIVKRGIIVGYGYHEKPGKPHAELVALQMAGPLSRSSSAFITLEPCVHWGRTPPCVESLIQVRPKRVVISALDPNPLVFKKGVKRLRQAGIQVSSGLLEEKNKYLNEIYLKYITKKLPFVAAKTAISLDGKIATKKFDSRWISSRQTREYVHLLRGEYDAIMVGISTLIKDDPFLTVRHRNWKGKKTTRIILDSRLRFPLNARIISTLSQGKIMIFTLKKASRKKAEALTKKGVDVVFLPRSSSKVDLQEVLAWLGRNEIASVLVEGGSLLLTSMFEQKLVDKIFLTISPKLIGGREAPSILQGDGADCIKDSLVLKRINSFQIDEDIIIEGYF